MGRMKDQLIDAPCHSCGKIDNLEYVGTVLGVPLLWCDLCRCTNDSCEEKEEDNE